MTRPIALMLLLTVISGCGEADRPRFVPATGDAPEASPAGRPAVDRAGREDTIPKNIPMH
jgi:hypothetical protein